MKKFLTSLPLLIFYWATAFAQKDSVTLDQLQVPTSPAFNVLGISPNSIERPKNPTDFALALGNATSGFTTIPKDYAIEIAPYWVFGKKQATFKDFKANLPGKNILQTGTFSIATTSAKSLVDSSEFRKMGLAIKFSIFRGHMGSQFEKWNDTVTYFLNRVSEISGQTLADTLMKDPELIKLRAALAIAATNDEKKRLQKLISDREEALIQICQKATDSLPGYMQHIKELTRLASITDFRRYGFKMDYAFGTAMDYPDSNFQNSVISKFSTWLTLGFEKENTLNWLGVIRYNQNINKFFRNDSNKIVRDINFGELDYGLRFYADVTSKLTLSFEILQRRKFFNEEKLTKNNVHLNKKTDRYVFSANYKVGKNQNLSFSYGKDFDDKITKQGNLVAALNFLIGFGSARPFGN